MVVAVPLAFPVIVFREELRADTVLVEEVLTILVQ
jgi:hypothetical protein